MSFTQLFWSLIDEEEYEIVEWVLEDSRFYYAVDVTGSTLLHCFVDAGSVRMTNYILEKGCDVNARDPNGDTPLILAMKRSSATVPLLVAAGADVELQNSFGKDLFSLAVDKYPSHFIHLPLFHTLKKKYSSIEMARRLIDHGYRLDSAVFSRDSKIVEYMIQSGIPVDFPTQESPLHFAVALGDVETVKVLLKHGAVMDALDSSGATPLHYLYSKERDFLKRAIPEISSVQDFSDTHEKLEILHIFLSKGVSLTSCDAHGHFQIGPALTNGTIEIVSAILQSKTDFAARNTLTGGTMLHALAFNRNPGIVDALKPHIGKFDVNVTDKFGHKPLSYAACEGNAVFAKFLLEHGAAADAAALLSAYFITFDRHQHPDSECLRDECAELLLQYNADPRVIFTTRNRYQVTGFETAVGNGSYDRIKLAIAQLAIREKQGTPLNEDVCYDINVEINEDQPFKSYLDKCRRLLRKKISGSASFFELLIADEKKMVKYLNNGELALKLARMGRKKELKSAYRYYYSTLKKKFTNGIISKTLRYKTAKIVRHISKNRLGLRDVPTDIIIENLSDNDLRRIYNISC